MNTQMTGVPAPSAVPLTAVWGITPMVGAPQPMQESPQSETVELQRLPVMATVPAEPTVLGEMD